LPDPCDHGSVVAGAHHVGEGHERRHEIVVLADRQLEERPVGVRDAHRLGLRPVGARVAEEPDVHARRRKPPAAELASAIGVGERHDDRVALLYLCDPRPYVLDDAYGLVAHAGSGLAALHLVVRVEVAAADAGTGDPDDGVGRIYYRGVWHVLDADVSGAEHNGCLHGTSSSMRWISLYC
jgi:hypothetical protein